MGHQKQFMIPGNSWLSIHCRLKRESASDYTLWQDTSKQDNLRQNRRQKLKPGLFR